MVKTLTALMKFINYLIKLAIDSNYKKASNVESKKRYASLEQARAFGAAAARKEAIECECDTRIKNLNAELYKLMDIK